MRTAIDMKTKIIVLLLVFICCSAPAESKHSNADSNFIFGISQGADEAIPYMKELGIHWGRISISWKEVMPEVKRPFPTLEEVQSNPELVDELIRKTDWSAIDRKIRYRIDNGIQPIPIIGSGWINSYPKYKGKSAYPDRIGKDHYLAFNYLYTRAVVERYDGDGYMDASGIKIKLWQTENELNQAGLTAGWGWREPFWLKGLSSAWANWKFLTRHLQTLYKAVKDADPESMTYMNFHTDIHPKMNRMLKEPDWPEAVRQWKDLMDIIGFDAYPNYYSADPIRAEVIGERVKTIRKIVGAKPVILVEVDYPFGPPERGYNPEKQAEFLKLSYQSARKAGVNGYFKFRVIDPKPNPTQISQKDLGNLKKIIPWWEEGKIFRLLAWALPRTRYVQKHFLDVLKSVEGNWGVINHSGKKLPAYYVLKKLAEENETGYNDLR